MVIKYICKLCGQYKTVQVDDAGWERFKAGTSIVDALPYLTDSQRKAITNYICIDCLAKEY